MHPLLIIAEKEMEKLECYTETSIAAPVLLLTSMVKDILGIFYCPNPNDHSGNEDRQIFFRETHCSTGLQWTAVLGKREKKYFLVFLKSCQTFNFRL